MSQEAKDAPERSCFRSEAVLRWRLREAQKQLQLVTEELNRTRSMLAALHRAGGPGRVLGSEDGQFGRLLQSQEDLKSDLCKLASAALRRDDAGGCALELWSKWELPWPPPARSASKAPAADAKAAGTSKDVRCRVRRRWRRIRLFVAFAFGHARRGTQPANRYLGFRVKEP
ncbi:unnamed protein product [Symbiodinium sp. CCMP2456]|nr:unnamed protein product [Symbiodinium sp. CCMP2456]